MGEAERGREAADQVPVNAAILFHLGLTAYAVSAAMYLAYLLKPAGVSARFGAWAMGVGFVFHGGAVAFRVMELARDGTFRFAEGLSFLAFLTVGAALLVNRFYRVPIIGAFVAPLVLAVLVPAHAIPGAEVPVSGSLVSVVLPLHIGVALAGVALFALGFGVALMYLLLERELKAKKLGAMFRRLPSLQLLDSLNYRLVVLGFVALSVTIVTGALFSEMATGELVEFGAKQTFALVAWGLIAAVVALRQTIGWRGRRVAVATMAGFVLMTFAYAGIFVGGAV